MHSDLLLDPLLQQAPTVGGRKYLEPALLLDLIGRGGMGAVYLGYHLNLKCPVAVKCMLPLASGTLHDELVERFRAEATMAASIDSPHLVRVLDVRQRHGVHYIVLEYVDGETIEDRVRRKNAPMGVEAACAAAYFAALGLKTAHARGVVHRDIKPSNVLVSKEGDVKILDLGIAKSFDAAVDIGVTRPDQVLGTPQYMPPELFEGAHLATPESDVYALAATLAYMLVGQHLIEGGGLRTIVRQVDRGFPDIGVLRRDLPRDLVAIVARATTADPAQRYRDAGEFAAALREHMVSTPSSAVLADSEAGKSVHALDRNRPPTRSEVKALLEEAERVSTSTPLAIPATLVNQGERPHSIPSTQHALPHASSPPIARPSSRAKRMPTIVGAALAVAALVVAGWVYFGGATRNSEALAQGPLDAVPGSTLSDGKSRRDGDGLPAAAPGPIPQEEPKSDPASEGGSNASPSKSSQPANVGSEPTNGGNEPNGPSDAPPKNEPAGPVQGEPAKSPAAQPPENPTTNPPSGGQVTQPHEDGERGEGDKPGDRGEQGGAKAGSGNDGAETTSSGADGGQGKAAVAGPAKVLVEFAPTPFGSFDARYTKFRAWFAENVLPHVGTQLVLTESAVDANWVVYLEFKSPEPTVTGSQVTGKGDFYASVLALTGGKRSQRVAPEFIVLNKPPTALARDKSGALRGAFAAGLDSLQEEAAAREELITMLRKAVSP